MQDNATGTVLWADVAVAAEWRCNSNFWCIPDCKYNPRHDCRLMPDIVGRLRTPRLSAAPSSPAVGEVYYDTGTNILYWWNGTSWVSASGGGAGSADLVYNGSFPANTPYTDGDIVVSNGVAYMCVRPTSATPTPWAQSGAGDLVYNGAFPSNTPYTDGDIVLQNGIAYLCVRPTSAAPTPWPRANTITSYNTSLPTSPVDGQEAILVDSVTNPTYIWHFRYNAGSTSAYKWEFIGGAPAVSGAPSPGLAAFLTAFNYVMWM